MKLRTFTLRFDAASGRFEDDELVQFMHGHEVLTVYEHMVQAAGEPVWGILVGYKAPRGAAPPAPRAPAPEEDTVEVDDGDRALYEALRRWRNDQARKTGRPAYIIMHNRQLAALARARPTTVAALREVPGVGEARARDYGQELLALVAQASAGAGGQDG